jgi:Transposase DDE domain
MAGRISGSKEYKIAIIALWKAKYRLHNWKNYNESLVNRGSLTFWFSEDVILAWNNHARSGKPGRPKDYDDTAILTMATLQEVYHLALRQTTGFLRSIFELLKLGLSVPDYSTLCRRRAALEKERLARDQNLRRIRKVGRAAWKKETGYHRRSLAETAVFRVK